jgi:hypothetical protein
MSLEGRGYSEFGVSSEELGGERHAVFVRIEYGGT